MSEENEKQTGNKPDWRGDGVAVWENTSKDGKTKYLTIQLLGKNGVRVSAFKNEEKKD